MHNFSYRHFDIHLSCKEHLEGAPKILYAHFFPVLGLGIEPIQDTPKIPLGRHSSCEAAEHIAKMALSRALNSGNNFAMCEEKYILGAESSFSGIFV